MSAANLLVPGSHAGGQWDAKRAADYLVIFDRDRGIASDRAARPDQGQAFSVAARAATLAEIDRLLEGEEAQANWDGLGAKAVSTETVKTAKEFIATLSYKVPGPDVSVTQDGSVCFTWMGPRRSVFIAKMTPEKRLVYGMSSADNRETSGEPVFEGKAIPDIEADLTTHVFPELAKYVGRPRA
jgi:hypothetical protein